MRKALLRKKHWLAINSAIILIIALALFIPLSCGEKDSGTPVSNWEKLYDNSDMWLSDALLNNGVAMFCGTYNYPPSTNYSAIIRSTNQGVTWNLTYESVDVSGSFNHLAAAFPGGNLVFASANGGGHNKMMRSLNNGATWTGLENAYGDITALSCLSDNKVWGANGWGLHYSSDGTATPPTWQTLDVPEESSTTEVSGLAVLETPFTHNGNILITQAYASSSRIYFSDDALASWTLSYTSYSTKLRSLSFNSDQLDAHGIAVGNEGEIVLTADGGTNWVRVLTPITDEDLRDVFYLPNSTEAWIVGEKEVIRVDVPSGLSISSSEVYNLEALLSGGILTCVTATTGEVWVGSQNGLVFRLRY